jgi:hypothetical protein
MKMGSDEDGVEIASIIGASTNAIRTIRTENSPAL